MNICIYILYVKEKICWICVMWKERGILKEFCIEWFMFYRVLCRECNVKEKVKGMGKYVCYKC